MLSYIRLIEGIGWVGGGPGRYFQHSWQIGGLGLNKHEIHDIILIFT